MTEQELTAARRAFLLAILAEGSMKAPSYCHEKIVFAFKCKSLDFFRGSLDEERLEIFDAEYAKRLVK